MKEREVDAVALGPSENMQGAIRRFSLLTGRILQWMQFDVKPSKWTHKGIERIIHIGNV